MIIVGAARREVGRRTAGEGFRPPKREWAPLGKAKASDDANPSRKRNAVRDILMAIRLF